MKRVIVVGGGAAGMFAAIWAAGCGHEVELLEKNEKLGKKIYITGKGRCNLTNDCDMDTLFESVCTNRKFLYSAFYGFTNQDVMDFFQRCGMKIKTERGGRVFPQSDHSSDVISALERELKRLGVKIRLKTAVERVLIKSSGGIDEENEKRKNDGSFLLAAEPHLCEEKSRSEKQGGKSCQRDSQVTGVELSNGSICSADAVIVATGGLSYASTGSTGDGYRFAREMGHQVTELSPALVPLTVKEEDARLLQGLSLRNVKVTVKDGKKVLYQDFGEMMFTHFGVTGPLILSASSHIQKQLKTRPLELFIDLKPALSREQLEARILREFEENKNRQFKNSLKSLYPAKLIPVMIARSKISPEKAIHDVSREERERLIQITRAFPLTITGLRGYSEAIITRGGVSVKEVNPQTMESKLVSGLYFAGEVLDLDAVTGGFNLQIAWSTGYAAGTGIREETS